MKVAKERPVLSISFWKD